MAPKSPVWRAAMRSRAGSGKARVRLSFAISSPILAQPVRAVFSIDLDPLDASGPARLGLETERAKLVRVRLRTDVGEAAQQVADAGNIQHPFGRRAATRVNHQHVDVDEIQFREILACRSLHEYGGQAALHVAEIRTP